MAPSPSAPSTVFSHIISAPSAIILWFLQYLPFQQFYLDLWLDSSDSVKNLAPILALVVAGKDTLETIETIHVAEIIQKSAIFPDIDWKVRSKTQIEFCTFDFLRLQNRRRLLSLLSSRQQLSWLALCQIDQPNLPVFLWPRGSRAGLGGGRFLDRFFSNFYILTRSGAKNKICDKLNSL